MHKMVEVPAGKSLADAVPAFSEVDRFVHVGKLNMDCPSCRKIFSEARKPRRTILIAWPNLALPIALSYRICGPCFFEYRQVGLRRDAMLAAVEAFVDGVKASQ